MRRCLSLVAALCLAPVLVVASSSPSPACDASDRRLELLRFTICDSLVQGKTWWCGTSYLNVTNAKTDWPNQAVYMHELVSALSAPSTCLNTSVAKDTIEWLETSQGRINVSGTFAYTWDVFQVQYYDMPRLPGTRIESPDTLGRKCWAFAYLRQMWQPHVFVKALSSAGLSANQFVTMYNASIPLTMTLCEKVMANCFVNASYDPSRKGSCKGKIFEFHYLGFDRENIKRSSVVKYPF